MDAPAIEDPHARERLRRRRRWSRVLTVLGFALMLAGVLRLTSATVGGRIERFEQRRTYVEAKRAAHRTYPAALALGLSGLALAVAGSRMRAPRA